MPASSLEELMAMGYSQRDAERALEIAGGDMEQAVGYLLMGDQSQSQLVVGDQLGDYSFFNGSVAVGLPETSSLPPAREPGAVAVTVDRTQELVQMGYSAELARDALNVANGDMDQAINYLLMGESRVGFHIDNSRRTDNDSAFALALQAAEMNDATEAIALTAHRPESAMYHTTTMKSDLDIPRMVFTEAYLKTEGAAPFCACTAASKFLSGGVVTAEFLNDILCGGIELFRKCDSPSWDVAKILKKYGKASLNITAIIEEGEPKDCIYMADDLHHGLGIRKQMAICRNQQPIGWQVLILEIPNFECICIALPPKGTKNKFWYIDFYPRSCFRVSGAHARVHGSLLQLEESLEAVFNGLLSSSKKNYENFKIYRIVKTKNSR